MKKNIFNALIIIIFLFFCHSTFAQTMTNFYLKDGSKVKGSLLKFDNQIYTVETEDLKTITLNKEDVMWVASDRQNAPQELNFSLIEDDQLKINSQKMQMEFMSDPDIVKELQDIAQDESITAIVSDPAFLKAVLSYDANAVMSNKNALKLMENPKIQRLMEIIGKKYNPNEKAN